jgi:anti-anti-sigma factor
MHEYALAEVVQELGEGASLVDESNIDEHAEPVRARFQDRGLTALALVPMRVGQEGIGFLSIERHQAGSFDRESLRFCETVVSQSAVAMRNLKLVEQTQSQLAELQKSYSEAARLADTVRQLSSPVIQVWQDVLVLPLVGPIDSRRATRIMEDLLQGISDHQAEQVIIDITGVPVMDTTVVHYLLQTIRAASLLGAKCMLVGIRSEMAQTIVELGLDLRDITTHSNLRTGIQVALENAGFAITRLWPDEGAETS